LNVAQDACLIAQEWWMAARPEIHITYILSPLTDCTVECRRTIVQGFTVLFVLDSAQTWSKCKLKLVKNRERLARVYGIFSFLPETSTGASLLHATFSIGLRKAEMPHHLLSLN
jgi:hypothetical protein